MAGGKETPRQKMIGMMYLVLTCLLAMNVSKDILKGFVTVDESLNRTNKNFSANINRVMDCFEEAKKSNPAAIPYFTKASEVMKTSEELFMYIEKLKQHLILKTEQPEDPKVADTLHLRFVDKKDNYDIPTFELIGGEPATPIEGPNSARELKGKITALHGMLLKMVEGMQKEKSTQFLKGDYEALKEKINTIKPEDPKEKEDDVPVTWELQNFFHLPLAAVLTNLSKIQSDIKNVEAEIVNQFAAASGKVAFKFDKLGAKVVATSSYVQAGTPYTADILLVASSSSFKEENLQILMGAKYDSVTKKLTVEGTPVPVVGGIGKYEVGTSAQGDQLYDGVIKLKKPTGEYDFYEFHGEYTVAAPSVAVSPDKMLVFYIGVPNPVSVSAAGIAPSNLQVSATGGVRLNPKGGGKYEAMASTPGDCNITVSAKTKDGTKAQGPPVKFRVKRIPDPIAKIGGKLGLGTLEFPKNQLAAIGGVVAELQGFDFDARFVVTGFQMSAVIKGALKDYSANGPGLTGEMKGILAQLGPGGKVFFENIKAKGPDGSVRTLPNVAIKVKK